MFIKSILLSAAIAAFCQISNAQVIGANCPYSQTIRDGTVVNLYFTEAYGCLLQVTPLNKPNLRYREYYFDERGRLMVFDSLGGDYDTSTATRSYFLFPRKQAPSYKVAEDGTLEVQMGNSKPILFLTKNARIDRFPEAQYNESPDIRIDGNSFGLQSYETLVLDAGFRVGALAYHDPSGKSVFRDENGATCEVANKDIFAYDQNIYGEPLFYAQTDQELIWFLKSRCPQISLKSLQDAH